MPRADNGRVNGSSTIVGTGPLLGVAGTPSVVANSLSPAMFAAVFAELGIPGFYVPLAIRERAARKAIRSLPRLGFRGVNVTMPYKEIAAGISHTRSELVARTGVANTLVIDDEGHIHAEATDGVAVASAIAAAGAVLEGVDVVLMGAGGAAMEAAYACADGGAARIRIWNRHRDRAAELAGRLGRLFPSLGLEVCRELPIGVPAHILVSAVPSAALDGEAIAKVGAAGLVIDLAYRHDRTPTPLIFAAREQGVVAVDGREILVRQGAASFTHWMGFAPPIEVMMRAVS